MGSGKSFYAKKVAEKININFIDLDLSIEEELQSSIAEVFETKGEPYFRNFENKLLKQKIINTTSVITIVATGGGTPCYYDNMNLMNQSGVTIWLNESIEKVAEQSFIDKEKRPLLSSLKKTDLHNYFEHSLYTRKEFYQKSQHILSESEISTENIEQIISQYV